MSQTKTASITKGTTTRRLLSGSGTQGAGSCKRWYIGYTPAYEYRAFGQFTLDATFWSGVGKIVSAILTLYTDDGLGINGEFVAASSSPSVDLRRATTSFSEGTDSSTFVSADYTNPGVTTIGHVVSNPSAGPLQAVQIDMTALIEYWAPATVLKRDGSPGSAGTNNGFALIRGDTTTTHRWAAISEDAEPELAAYRPVLTLTYELGVTQPNVPTNLTPTGSVTALADFEGDFTDPKTTDQLRRSQVRIYAADGVTVLYDETQDASNASIVAGRFHHTADSFTPVAGTTYKWSARVLDNEAQWSAWTAQVSFSVTNTAPNAPTLTPDAATYSTLDGVHFRSGAFSDPDTGDTMQAYQVQLSAYPALDVHWDDDASLLWNSGKRLVPSGATSFDVPYGGTALAAGTYYWRARVYDNHGTASAWTYATITLSADFIVDPANASTAIQLRPRAPWRIVIRDMFQSDGVTPTAGRGPGRTVAVLEDAYNVGASKLWNSPGDFHFTIPFDHPQIAVIEPKQTHYAVEFRQGDGWREVYQGLISDFDANDRDVIFYGIDYKSALDQDLDDRYDPAAPDKPAESGGSKYVTTGKNSIGYIVYDLLTKARDKTNSLTGFISPLQSSATLTAMLSETVTLFSTYEPYLSFIASLLDSHRAGTGKRTMLDVVKQADGSYKWVVTDDPGIVRDNLRLRWGELVQGFRVVAFGPNWHSRVGAIGRDKNGTIVRYLNQAAPTIDESVWGRWMTSQYFDGVSDANDFARKAKQAAVAAGKLGSGIGVALRQDALQPFDGYTLPDYFPVDIERGAVSTSAMGSGYWACVGVTWTANQQGQHNTILTLQPREDSAAPDPDLLLLQPISPQAVWQIGWQPPTTSDTLLIALDTGLLMDGGHLMDEAVGSAGTLAGTGRYHIDVTTGAISELQNDGTWAVIANPPTILRPSSLIPTTRVTVNDAGVAVANLSVTVTP